MIDKKQIEHLAKLSRLELTPFEIDFYQQQIDDILQFVSVLQKVDTSNIQPGFYLDNKSALRPDETKNSFVKSDLIAALPETKDGLLKTPKIFS